MDVTVSVVMAAYNAQATILAAVDSVLAQQGMDFELIVVDDGSSDGTAERVRQLADPRVRVLSQANAGPAAARNLGAAQAQGEFLAWIDADDLWRPGKLARQVQAMRNAPGAALVYAWADIVESWSGRRYPDLRATCEGEVVAALMRKNFIPSGSIALVPTALFRELGGFDPQLRAAEDWDLYLRLALAGDFVCVPEVLVEYRLQSNSITANLALMDRAYLRVFDRFAAMPEVARRLAPDVRKHSVSDFYLYLGARAFQSRRLPASVVLASYYCLRALWLVPANWKTMYYMIRNYRDSVRRLAQEQERAGGDLPL